MSTLLLDTHVVQWWSAEPERLSRTATSALEQADELALLDREVHAFEDRGGRVALRELADLEEAHST